MNSNLKDLIYKIENELNIEDIIGNYLDLKKHGNNFLALCPFHNDSNPSLTISPTKKIYKCFSCGAGGNAITFVQNFKGTNFIETLKLISEQYNIDWKEYIDDEKYEKKDYDSDIIKKINFEANKFFRFQLNQELKRENSKLSKYLKSRKIIKEDIGYYDIGFANDKINVFDFLLGKGFKNEDILKTHLGTSEKNYFNNRLIFSIKNSENEILGFSGRAIDSKEKLKYLISKENKIFKKSLILYNFNNSKSQIKIKNEVILVEGFFDVFSLRKANYENVVATMGVSLSEESVDVLKKIAKNVILIYDKDRAGREASLKIAEKFIKNKLNVWIYDIPQGKDIDEFLTNNGELSLENNKKKFIIFLLDNIFEFYDRKYFSSKEKKEIFELITFEDNDFDKESEIKKFNEIFNTNYTVEHFIAKDINKYEKKPLSIQNDQVIKLEKKIFEKELILFHYLLEDTSLFKFLNDEKFFFHNYKLRLLFDKINLLLKLKYELRNIINEKITADEKVLIDKIQKRFSNDEQKHFIDLTNKSECQNFINSIIFPLRKKLEIEKLRVKLRESENNKEEEILEIILRIIDLK